MGHEDRVTYEVAVERLHQFETLSGVIKDMWLNKQMGKQVEAYSLITGWLTTSPAYWNGTYHRYTQALEDALSLLKDSVPANLWNKTCKKLRAPSDRAESKGTLAELSLAVFLVTHGIPFDMEIPLQPPTDVDFSVKLRNPDDVYIEMLALEESAASRRTSRVSAAFGMPVSIDFKKEERRIRGKIYDKTPKLVENKITLVALDCTLDSQNGGIGRGTIPDALSHIFGHGFSVLDSKEMSIRQLVDGVIWFQVDFDNALQPIERDYLLNKHSEHHNSASLHKWIALWQ